MKKFTVGDGYAVMILASQRMGLKPGHLDDAKRLLEGGAIHPMVSAAMSATSAEMNNQLRHDEALVAKANIHAELIKAEFGFLSDISKEAFLVLQDEVEGLELAHAKGQDMPGSTERLEVIDRIMNGAQWTLHPDHGCTLKSEVNAKDRALAA